MIAVSAPHPRVPTSVVITAIVRVGSESRLIGTRLGVPIAQAVPAVADIDGARRWLRTTRRVHQIEIDMSDRAVSAVADGVGFRLPFIRPIPLTLALGLGELGIRVVLRREDL